MNKGLRLVLLIAFGLAACQSEEPEIALEGTAQGTTYHVKIVPQGIQVSEAEVHRKIEAVFSEIDTKLSNYRDDSEIARLNATLSTEWLPVSPEIAKVIGVAKAVYSQSRGCYDLTVKPLFDLWGFSRHENTIPTDAQIKTALSHVGMSRLDVDEVGQRIRKQDPDLKIDLSSIAQGYSVATIAALLEQEGITAYMVEIGGELKVRGTKADGSAWRIAIEKPTPFTREVQRILEFHQQRGTAVMTAGTYRNFFEDRGQIYSHIIDPRTGRPVTHHLLSVTVLHDDPTWADAWDTALLCMGEKEAVAAAETNKLKALLIYREGDTLKEYMSSALAASQEGATDTQTTTESSLQGSQSQP